MSKGDFRREYTGLATDMAQTLLVGNKMVTGVRCYDVLGQVVFFGKDGWGKNGTTVSYTDRNGRMCGEIVQQHSVVWAKKYFIRNVPLTRCKSDS